MDSAKAPAIPPMDGPVGYPRKNGAPVFEAPWQSRAFGMVVNLHVQGLYPWDDFKQRLIDAIAAGAATDGTDAATAYYESWVQAFSRLLAERHLLDEDEILRRAEEFKVGVRRQVF